MRELNRQDLQWALRRTPAAVLKLLKDQASKVFVGGGFLRACVAGEKAEDIDLFVASKANASLYAELLATKADGKVIATENAYTVKGYALPVQIIHRWVYEKPEDLMRSFDFTIAMAGFWWQGCVPATEEVPGTKEGWRSICDDRFYEDLAAKRLRYTAPVRHEDAGGSLLRVLKFYQRGYRIPLDSLAGVTARLLNDVEAWKVLEGRAADREVQMAKVITGLLREVDPNIDPSHIAHLPAEDYTHEEDKFGPLEGHIDGE
jgi:hypothetical protein